ncbi:hypothetical protein AA23498_2638 [Acetobacter nitrogenifigens DSM 23921 = NBRC 105050]|nr:hypothetical protein AA23498_2638 [Acetobacter nitrogenifigens DSM 23921 = NBRC 105050]
MALPLGEGVSDLPGAVSALRRDRNWRSGSCPRGETERDIRGQGITPGRGDRARLDQAFQRGAKSDPRYTGMGHQRRQRHTTSVMTEAAEHGEDTRSERIVSEKGARYHDTPPSSRLRHLRAAVRRERR